MKYIATLSVIALSIGFTVSAVVEKTPALKLTSANDDFGLRLMQTLEQVEHTKAAQSRANVFVSPFSVNSVLAMLLAGGAEQTHSQIYKALGFSNSQLTDKDIFENLHSLFTEVTTQTSKGKDNVLNIANSLAIQKEYPILESFLSNITTYFGSHVFTEDFTQEAHKATEEINNWVNEQTHGKIAKLFNQDLEASTRLVLLNAIYFKGTWKTIFAKNHTAKSQFHMGDAQEEIDMMNVMSHFNYVHSDDGQLLELPYQDETLAMYIFLPSDKTKTISSTFSADMLTERITHLHSNIVNVHIPKFKFEQTYHLAETLKHMGIDDAFSKSGKADFSNIDGKKEKRVLYLSDVVHKTFIEVNEEGSEAAAATGAIINPRPRPGPPPPPIIQFRADHPFMFFIRHKQYGLTLFSGIVNKP